jgi:hypothetical protein
MLLLTLGGTILGYALVRLGRWLAAAATQDAGDG